MGATAWARATTRGWCSGTPLLKDVPGTLVQGRLDPGNLLGTPGVVDALVTATDRYARR